MTVGIRILACFAALWALGGLAALQLSWVWFALPLAVSGLALFAAGSLARRLPRLPPAERQRIKRLVGRWSLIEGLGICLALALVFAIGRPQLGTAAICLVVGLHFLPLARFLPEPIYYASAVALIGLSLAGLVMPALVPPALIALGAALAFWLTILAVWLRLSARAAAAG